MLAQSENEIQEENDRIRDEFIRTGNRVVLRLPTSCSAAKGGHFPGKNFSRAEAITLVPPLCEILRGKKGRRVQCVILLRKYLCACLSLFSENSARV